MTINWEFIAKLEGNRQLKGYVPGATDSQSGVTVATGVDLGHRTRDEVQKWPINNELKQKIMPYLGLRGSAAVAALQVQPLTITENEGIQLETVVAGPIFDELRGHFDRAAGKDAFFHLPDAAQTVLASLAYQYGPALHKRTPKFWSLACKQDWASCITELEQFGDKYPTRRKREAELLRSLMAS